MFFSSTSNSFNNWGAAGLFSLHMQPTQLLIFTNIISDSFVTLDSKMQNLESAAANYAAQQQAMGFPNMGTEDPYAGQQVKIQGHSLF